MKGADSGFYPDHSRFGGGCGFSPYTKRESEPLGLILRCSRGHGSIDLGGGRLVDVMTFCISANIWDRDQSLKACGFSLNTLAGRVLVPFALRGMERFFDGTGQFGTAHLVHRHERWCLHVPMTQEMPETDWGEIRQVVGLVFGINFLVTAYDSQGRTTFVRGRAVKARRAHFKILRQNLQRRQTPSARRRLKCLGQRENRWMTDVNHQASKALVDQYGAHTLSVLEDLTGIRGAAERVRRRAWGAVSQNLGGSMTSGIHDFHRLAILNQATPRRHWRVLLSLEKKRYMSWAFYPHSVRCPNIRRLCITPARWPWIRATPHKPV